MWRPRSARQRSAATCVQSRAWASRRTVEPWPHAVLMKGCVSGKWLVGLDLTEIEGISELTALTIISEIGPEVSKFPTVKKFCSWLGLCPNWKKTGGRVKSSRTRPGVNRAATTFRLAAHGLHRSQGALGAFLRRMKSRLGVPAALTATAHKLARIVYLALKRGLPYVRKSQEEYEAQMKEKQIKAVKRKARQLGLEVVEKAAGGVQA